MVKRLYREIQCRRWMRPGERVGVAVSGGADSVALFRALEELRTELGIVLSILHFHHGIRGAAADADEDFVRRLSERFGVECLVGRGNVPEHAQHSRQSMETAARELRYQFFYSVLNSGSVDKIATAHTMDDQAETILMRTLRGAGTRGLSGIHAERDDGRIIRPLLATRRSAIEEYLQSLKQEWLEDATNSDRKHFRNRVRHDLLPSLAKAFNPNIVEVLARSAEVAQGEEHYWADEIARWLPLVLLPGMPTRGGGRRSSPAALKTVAFDAERLGKYPLALQRRLLLTALHARNIECDSEHIEALVALVRGDAKTAALPGGWSAHRSLRELRLEQLAEESEGKAGYLYPLEVPGEASIAQIKLLVQARLEHIAKENEGYNSGQADLVLKDGVDRLTVRNWQAGDRLWAEHSKAEKKVKDILQQLKVPAEERPTWPVVAAGDALIWTRGSRQRPVRVKVQNGFCRLIIEARDMA